MTERAGSCWYVSPEQLLAPTDYGAGVDIWGAGCVLVEMLVGKAAFAGNNDFHQVNFLLVLYRSFMFTLYMAFLYNDAHNVSCRCRWFVTC